MAPAVDNNGTITIRDQSWNLGSPIATVAQTAMQQDYRCAGPKSAIPDAGSVILDIAQVVAERKWRGPGCLESNQLVIVSFHGANVNALSRLQIGIRQNLEFPGSPAHAASLMIEYVQQINLVEPGRMLEETFVSQACM